jgi:hypothetical protein
MPSSRSAVFFEAAQRIYNENDFSCNTIDLVSWTWGVSPIGWRSSERMRYADIFAPYPQGKYFKESWWLSNTTNHTFGQEARVFALLLACEMAKTGDL